MHRLPGAPARAAVEVAPDQQEEEQGDGRIEIGVLFANPGLVQADDAGERHADRDRHVHVGAPGTQRAQGRAEERPAGIGDRRQGDGRRQPVEKGARGIAHRAVMARPDGHREQHHVGRREARDRHGAQQLAGFAIVAGRGGDGVVGRQPEAEGRDQAGMPVGVVDRSLPRQRQAARRQMDPRARDRGIARQQALDQPDAGGAVEPVDQKLQRGTAVSVGPGISGEVDVERFGPVGTRLFEAAVEGAQAGGADDGVRAGAARATEQRVRPAAQRLAAMRAGSQSRGSGDRRGVEDRGGHLRNIRRVCAKCWPPCSTEMSASQLPRAGRVTWPE